jgi:hypothetical protein
VEDIRCNLWYIHSATVNQVVVATVKLAKWWRISKPSTLGHADSCLTIISTLVICCGQSLVPVCIITCHDMLTNPDIVLSLCVKFVCLMNLLVINCLLEHLFLFMFNTMTYHVSYTSNKWMTPPSSNQLATISVTWCWLIYCRLEQIVIVYHNYCFFYNKDNLSHRRERYWLFMRYSAWKIPNYEGSWKPYTNYY